MLKITEGQCGLCEHFGEDTPDSEQIVQIRIQGVAPEDYTDACGHPTLKSLKLEVSPISGCAGFTPIKKAG